MIKKGIILAGGTGSRMSPITKAVNKQLLPIYDKPLIYYPLSLLMLIGIKNFLIIVNKKEKKDFQKLLGNGENLGIKINYCEQKKPTGIPEAFKLGENFINNDNVALMLGDNIFYGQGLIEKPKKTKSNLAITGLYFFDKNVVEISKKLKPSKRNETEIIDILKHQLFLFHFFLTVSIFLIFQQHFYQKNIIQLSLSLILFFLAFQLIL